MSGRGAAASQGAAASPGVGDAAPDFTLPADDGTSVSLAALRGQPVVLFFYPEDETPGCTAQACEFRDDRAAFQAAGALVFGISPDGVASHAAFRRNHQLSFPLLADEGHRVAGAYGVWGEKRLFAVRYEGIKRTTFVIDGDGVIRMRLERSQGKGHAAAALALLQRIRTGVTT